MTLTYQESAELMRDSMFIDRVMVGCLHYAEYIANEDDATPAHNSRIRWARDVMENPTNVAAKMTPTVVMDPVVQEQGGTISDADLQLAVETAVNKLL
jgi:hypothetical protein